MSEAARRLLGALPGAEIVCAPPSPRSEAGFRRRLGKADAALVIAPEGGGRLARLARAVERSAALPLGSGPRAARLAGDKLATARLLARAGIATPPTLLVGRDATALRALARVRLPVVVKPRDGCGADGVEVVRRRLDLPDALARARRAARRGGVIAQPYFAGMPLSVTLLVRGGSRLRGARGGDGAADRAVAVLAVARQRLTGRRSLRYLGGELPVGGARAAAAARLAVRAAAALAAGAPDLRGAVGVDLVIGRDGPVVIEINPRLTSSWIGLRRIAGDALGRLLVDAAQGRPLPRRVPTRGRCRFSAGGRVTLLSGTAPAARRARADRTPRR
jgi:predicted ATP-grasp superfamily ATP-dependent carboligase